MHICCTHLSDFLNLHNEMEMCMRELTQLGTKWLKDHCAKGAGLVHVFCTHVIKVHAVWKGAGLVHFRAMLLDSPMEMDCTQLRSLSTASWMP